MAAASAATTATVLVRCARDMEFQAATNWYHAIAFKTIKATKHAPATATTASTIDDDEHDDVVVVALFFSADDMMQATKSL